MPFLFAISMTQSKYCVIAVFLSLCFFTCISVSGFSFFINQYIFFRYLEKAGLPYDPPNQKGCKHATVATNGSSHRITDARDDAQAQTAYLLGWTSFLSLGLSMLAVNAIGFISDRYGRLPALAVVLLGQGLNHILIAFMTIWHWDVIYLAPAAIAVGVIGGGYIAFIVQISVCFADLTKVPDTETPVPQKLTLTRLLHRTESERDRLILFGMFDATVTLAGALASGVMGSVIDHLGFEISVLGILAIYCIPVILIWFLPETKHSVNRSISVDPPALSPAADLSDIPVSVVQSTLSGVRSLWNLLKSEHPATLLVFIVLFLYSLVALCDNHFVFLFLMSEPLCWTAESVGIYNGVGSLVMAVSAVVLTLITAHVMRTTTVPVETPHSNSSSVSGSTVALLRPDDEDVTRTAIDPTGFDLCVATEKLQVLHSRLKMLIYVVVGISMLLVSKIIMGCISSLRPPYCTVAAILSLAISLVRGAVVPTLKSFLSTLHPATVQARLFSLVGMTEYAGLLIGIPGLPAIYAATVASYPGSVFFFTAGLCLLALMMIVLLILNVVKEMVALKQMIRNTAVIDLADS